MTEQRRSGPAVSVTRHSHLVVGDQLMSAATELFAFGLRQVIDVAETAGQIAEAAGPAGAVIALVRRRLTDHSETLPRALAGANDRAWQAVAVALAGRGFLTRVKEFFTGQTPRAVHDQVEAFLAREADSFPGTSEEFRRACLRELHLARKVRRGAVPPSAAGMGRPCTATAGAAGSFSAWTDLHCAFGPLSLFPPSDMFLD
jgi:hypothetical protein